MVMMKGDRSKEKKNRDENKRALYFFSLLFLDTVNCSKLKSKLRAEKVKGVCRVPPVPRY
jgi:hypothetical protein